MKKSGTTLINFKKEFSAGCVVYKKEKAKTFFLLGKHSGYHKWVLPKGLIEAGEKGWQTAVRETKEEIGVQVRLLEKKPIHTEKYVYVADYKEKQDNTRRVEKYEESGGEKTKVFKTVSFYLAKYESGDPKDHDWEMEAAGWFSFAQAQKLMSFKGEKQALQKAKERIKELKRQTSLF